MQVATEIKQRIVKAMLQHRSNFTGTDKGYATSLGIHKSVFAQLKNGKTDRVLSEMKWVTMARRLNVQISNEPAWQTAQTPVFLYITEQLEMCQAEGTSGIFCDKADIGKTYTAKVYVRTHKNAVYVDCSQVKCKQKLVRFIAKEFGVDHTGKYSEVFEDLAYYLKTVLNPLIILDEAGDLDYSAFLELKALWNATEGYCGWYMMGADGLKKKIDRGVGYKKVGFSEIFRRYGSRYQTVVPNGTEAQEEFMMEVGAMIVKANLPQVKEVKTILIKAKNSLTRIQTEVKKLKRTN
jgi:hypothetical protein